MSTPVIETERLTLRPPGPQDEAAIVTYYMSERARFTGGNVPKFQAWKNFAAMLGHWQVRGFGLWAVTAKNSDTALGLVGPFFPETWPEHELGWLVFEDAEGRGIAHEAAVAARTHAYSVLGWTTAVSYIRDGNDRSVALAQRLGCQRDSGAPLPPHADQANDHVYRHPAPEELA
ncbi:MAG: GNAT family N-acetyltransferase [Pseudomonadota bacterium]